MNEILTVGDVARVFGISPRGVRAWDRLGKLSGLRTASGMRLFLRADVERARRDRDQRVGKFARPRGVTQPRIPDENRTTTVRRT